MFEYLQGANIQTFKRIKKIFYVLNYHLFFFFSNKTRSIKANLFYKFIY